MTLRVVPGRITPLKRTDRKSGSEELFSRWPVFSLEEATRELAPAGGRQATLERLRYHLETGRLRLVTRGVYAVVPRGAAPEGLRPDPFLVAAAARPDAVFCYHSALELLGVANAVWNECTVFTSRRRRPVELEAGRVRFLEWPEPVRAEEARSLGTRRVERRGRLLTTTGPERTLVEGFRRPELAGGSGELVLSASAFPVLDLELLEAVLERYAVANLWAATGWFLERFRQTFHVPEDLLERIERRVPAAPQYLRRGRRGGRLEKRWNLIVPDELERLGGPDER